MASLKLYANPYAYGGRGFYFSDFDEYEEKEAKSPHEEWMIEFIDGDDNEQALFAAMQVNQGNLYRYFDVLDEGWDDSGVAALSWLMDSLGMSLDDALEKVEDVYLAEGSAEDYAYDYLEEAGYPTDNNWYFDYEAFGRDISIEGSMAPDPDEYDEGEDDEGYIDDLDDYERKSHTALGEEAVDGWGGIGEMSPELVQRYFDHAAFARDATMNGDWAEYSHAGQDYVVTNANTL